jgi:hypothetical protein
MKMCGVCSNGSAILNLGTGFSPVVSFTLLPLSRFDETATATHYITAWAGPRADLYDMSNIYNDSKRKSGRMFKKKSFTDLRS